MGPQKDVNSGFSIGVQIPSAFEKLKTFNILKMKASKVHEKVPGMSCSNSLGNFSFSSPIRINSLSQESRLLHADSVLSILENNK